MLRASNQVGSHVLGGMVGAPLHLPASFFSFLAGHSHGRDFMLVWV
jgi:hypothetical protein